MGLIVVRGFGRFLRRCSNIELSIMFTNYCNREVVYKNPKDLKSSLKKGFLFHPDISFGRRDVRILRQRS